MLNSNISKLRNQIETELTAMRLGLSGLAAGVAKHQFIETKMKNVGTYEKQLATHIGAKQAVQFSCEAYIHMMEGEVGGMSTEIVDLQGDREQKIATQASLMPGKPIDLIYPVTPEEMKMTTAETTSSPPAIKTRKEVLQEIRTRFGADQTQTDWLIDGLIAAWDAIDRFTSIFGGDVAQTYIQAGFEPVEEGPHDDDDA